MTDAHVYTVSEVAEGIRQTLENEWSQVRIRGECSNVTYHRSGHIYFVLKDGKAELRCVLFKGYATYVRFRLDQGVEVIATGRITVFTQRGQLQCVVTAIQPAGQGNLYLAFERLKQHLLEEGLFAQERKQPLPVFPRRVGILTSDTGAAIRDILHVLQRRAPYVTLIHRPTLVQGPQAADDIVRGLHIMESHVHPDCIILGRGGGSIEDLWPFNEEIVARAMAQCSIPIISAVGHETDTTIADLVADMRAPTPSAAAELVAPSGEDLTLRLTHFTERLVQGMTRKLSTAWPLLDHWERRLVAQIPRKQLEQKRVRISDFHLRIRQAWSRQVSQFRLQLARYQDTLTALNPAQVLERGYALALKPTTDDVIDSVAQLSPGDKFRLRVRDGEFLARRQPAEAT